MRAQQRDQMMRAWMQNQQMGAQRSMQQEDMGARERMFNAELADRGAGRQYNGGLQMNMLEMGQKPQMAQLDFSKQKYTDERSDGAGTRDFANLQAQYKAEMLRQAVGGSGAGMETQDPMAGQDARAMKFGLLGLQAPRDVNMENQDFIRQIIKAKMAADPNADFAGYGEALKYGNLGAIPQKAQETIPLEMVGKSLSETSKSFGERDAATIGWDPTEDDVSGIVKKRDQYAQAVRARNPRLTPEQAVEQANYIVESEIAPNAGRMGVEWIARLKQALRGQATPGVPPSLARPDDEQAWAGIGQ